MEYMIFALLLIAAVLITHHITKKRTKGRISILSTIFEDTCPDCQKRSIQFTATAGIRGEGNLCQAWECLKCDEIYLDTLEVVTIDARAKAR